MILPDNKALKVGGEACRGGDDAPVLVGGAVERARQEVEAGGVVRAGHVEGDAVKRLPGNVNFCFEGIEGESLLLLLDDRGICASSGSACTSGSLDPSHVLLAIGRVHDVAHGSLRLTIGEDATEAEADYIVKNVTEVVEYLRSFSPIWRDLEAGKKPYIL